MRTRVWAMVVLGWVGCDRTVCESAAAIDPALEIGLGLDRFETPLAPGDMIPRVHGPQGGTHVELAVRTQGFHPGTPQFLSLPKDPPIFAVTLTGTSSGLTIADQVIGNLPMIGDEVEAELGLGRIFTDSAPEETSEGMVETETYFLEIIATDACGTELIEGFEVGVSR